jgi:hypothetical protein
MRFAYHKYQGIAAASCIVSVITNTLRATDGYRIAVKLALNRGSLDAVQVKSLQ